MARVRARLRAESRVAFAEQLGLRAGTYFRWEAHDSAPSMASLKQGVKRLGVWGWKDLVIWLADGEDAPPPWLEDETLDPRREPAEIPGGGPPRPGPAMPFAVLAAADEARHELDAAQSAGELRTPHVTRAWTALDGARAELDAAVASCEESGDASDTSRSGGIGRRARFRDLRRLRLVESAFGRARSIIWIDDVRGRLIESTRLSRAHIA